MSITLEHANLLRAKHNLPAPAAEHAVHVARRHGVRRHNVALNTGARVYAFNWMQQQFLPPAYRPPEGSARGGKA